MVRDMPVHITHDKSPEIQLVQRDNREFIRCRTPENLREFLAGSVHVGLNFSAHPIAGEPERFHYDPGNEIVTQKNDGRSFELKEFLCYAFQCDIEGYSHTEYVDIAPDG